MDICLLHPNILWEICRYLTPNDIRAIASTNTTLRTSGREVAIRLNTLCYECSIIRDTKLVLGMRKPTWWCEDCSEDNAWQCQACYCYDTRIFTALSVQSIDAGSNEDSDEDSDEEPMFVHRAGECVFDNCGICDCAIAFRMNAWILKSRQNNYHSSSKSIGCETSDITCINCVRDATKLDDDCELDASHDLMGDYCLAGSWAPHNVTEPIRDKLGWAESFLEFEYKREINIDYVGMLNDDQYSATVVSNISSHNSQEPILQCRNSSLICKRCSVAFDDYHDMRYVSAPIVSDVGIRWIHSVALNSEYQESTFVLGELNIRYAPQSLGNLFGLYCADCLRLTLDADRYADIMSSGEFTWNDGLGVYGAYGTCGVYDTIDNVLNNSTRSLSRSLSHGLTNSVGCDVGDIDDVGDVDAVSDADEEADIADTITVQSNNYSSLIYARIHRIKHWPKYGIDCMQSDYSGDGTYHVSELDERTRSNSV